MIYDCKQFQDNIDKYKPKKDDKILVSGRGNEYVVWYECNKCKQTTYKIRDIAMENY